MIYFVNHLVHASYLRDQGVLAQEGPLKEEAVATAAAVISCCCLSISPKPHCPPVPNPLKKNLSYV